MKYSDNDVYTGVWITTALAAIKGAGKGISAISKAVKRKKKKQKAAKTALKNKKTPMTVQSKNISEVKKPLFQNPLVLAGAGAAVLIFLLSKK